MAEFEETGIQKKHNTGQKRSEKKTKDFPGTNFLQI
jgi:hypothetical protein